MSTKLNKQIGDAVRRYRVEHQLSQQQLAAALQLTQSHVSRIESARQNLKLSTLQWLQDHELLRVEVS